MTGIRQKVKSGELTTAAALKSLHALQKKGEFVGQSIIRWLERRQR